MPNSYESFGKYLLLEKIASGGMAEIYLARSGAANGLNKFFAIKRILPQFSTNEDFVSMFKEEAKVAINLNHSNVASIFDFGIEGGQFYLVMDYIEGRNLRQIINELKKANKSFSIDQALYLVKETAAGLDHAHRCVDSTSGRPLNITHRDMSPQNIMISFEGEVKVIDFGIAKAETEAEDTKAGTLKGKFSYMSPEQAEGQNIDPRTDVFALGIVLWELLANDRLFTGSNEAAILRKVRDCQVPAIRKINPTVPPELERIVMKALAKDRNVRYQTAANLHRDLNRFLNTQYPDFSPQDFSHFIKDYFKKSYQDGREKLIQYSNIVIEEPNILSPPKATLPEVPDKQVPTDLPEAPNSAPDLPEVPSGLSSDLPPVGSSMRVKLDDLRSSTTAKDRFNAAYATTKPAPFPNPSETRVSQVSYKNTASNANDFMDILLKVALLVVICVGGWWGYNNYLTPKKKTRIAVQNPIPKVNQTDQSSLAVKDIKVSVNSNPPNAQIILNGRDTGHRTPALITVQSGTEPEITIRKEGYLEYRVTRKFTETSEVTATLQSSVAMAFLNIVTSEKSENAFTKVSINGKELLEKTPILKYPIVADKEFIISAYNPISKQYDQVSVKAKPNEVLDVQLILGRVPASQDQK